jgi:hypothetical protein
MDQAVAWSFESARLGKFRPDGAERLTGDAGEKRGAGEALEVRLLAQPAIQRLQCDPQVRGQ